MYFWRIKDLKSRLVQSPLSDREALPYLVAYTASTGLVTLLPPESYNGWDLATGLLGVALAFLGPIWVYRQNGGNAGTYLLQRFLAIGWVLLIRVLAFVGPILVVFYMVASATFKPVSGSDWYDVLIITGIQLVFYQRIGSHVRDIARTA